MMWQPVLCEEDQYVFRGGSVHAVEPVHELPGHCVSCFHSAGFD